MGFENWAIVEGLKGGGQRLCVREVIEIMRKAQREAGQWNGQSFTQEMKWGECASFSVTSLIKEDPIL